MQEAAGVARAEARTLHDEKEELGAQLETAMLQIEQLRSNERESRAQFVEITSVIRERDAAVQEAARVSRMAADTQRQLEAAVRERGDAQRQRDEVARRQAEEGKRMQHAMSQLTEAQKQIICLRQARDTANAQNLQLNAKLGRADDELAELAGLREAAQRTQEQTQEEVSQLRRQLGTVTADRDATLGQVQDLSDQLDEARKKFLDLVHEKAAASEPDSRQTTALAEARQQVANIAVERDAARLRSQELVTELEALRADVAAMRTRLSTPSVPAEQINELQRQIATLTGERDSLATREHRLSSDAATLQERLAQLTAQIENATYSRDEAALALEAAQRRFEHELEALDAKHGEEAGRAVELEAQIAALRSQSAGHEENLAAANRRVMDLAGAQQETRQLAARFEKQRLAMIDLGTRLDAAQREIVELSANLAEARLAARFANARAAKEAAAAIKEQLQPVVDAHQFAHAESLANADASDRRRAEPLAPENRETLSEKEARSALAAMRQCFHAFQKNSTDLSLINELYSHAFGFSERARVSGYVALHRLCSAFANFVHETYEFPEMLNPSTLRTMGSTIDFLGDLLRTGGVAQIKDPAKVPVFIVDDDPDNCDAIKMAMETTMLRATTTEDPIVALSGLAESQYGLIILDVNLPGMDGFELCSNIRQIPGYATTPVVFLTGMTSLENRVQSSLSGGNDFVGKPFNLHELTVKVLTLILKSDLMME